MTTQLITPIPAQPTRHRQIRTAAAIAGITALLATGGYAATTIIGHDDASPTAVTGATVNPSAQATRELRESVAGQYGSRPTPAATVNPSAQATRELRESVAGQYASRPASAPR